MTAGDVYFGSQNLNDGTALKVVGPLPIPINGPELLRLPYAAREGSAISYARYPEKLLTVSGVVRGATVAVRESNLDTLAKALNNGSQNLKTGWQDERYLVARLMGDVRVERPAGSFFFPWVATFLVADPFAYAASPTAPAADNTALVNVSGSLYRKTLTLTPGGTAPTRPSIQIVVPHAGPYGTSTITVRNTSVTPNQAITITRTFAADDTLVIDCNAFTVTVNGTAVDYSGSFPTLDPRAGITNSLQIDATSSSTPTLNVSPTWTSRWFS